MADYPLPHNSADLTGQVALVTGATSGLGWRFARVLAKAGAHVVIAGRRTERLEQLAALIRAEGGTAHPVRVDMMDADDILAMVNSAEAALGQVTILVNNAGIADGQLATRMSPEFIDQILGINVRGPFILATDIARRLIKTKTPGRIINIASIAAFEYDGNGAALYSTSKAAIARMTEALAVEWGKFPINVNAIAPGAFKSEMTDAMFERMGDVYNDYRRKRLPVPAQLDSTLLYLCSPASDAVTGTIIKVDDAQTNR